MTDDTPLIAMASADRCSSCNSPMTPDQRYCLQCGVRRGKPRFSLSQSQREVAATASPTRERRRVSSSVTLLTGLAVLVLALGTGVLIGHTGGSSAATGKPKINVVINGAGSGSGNAASAAASTTASSSNTTTSSSKGSNSAPTSTVKASSGGNLSTKVDTSKLKSQKQRVQAVSKVNNSQVNLGNGKKLAPQSQKIGGSCSAGTSGCQGGKFTGNFFGN